MRTTAKAVTSKVQQHILGYFGESDGWDSENPVTNLKQQMDVMVYDTKPLYQGAKELVEDGCFLAYHSQVNQFMDSLDINDKQINYTDEQTWDLYVHLLAREICKLVN